MKEVRWKRIRPGDLILDRTNKEWTVADVEQFEEEFDSELVNLDHSMKITLKDDLDEVASGQVSPLQLVRRVYTAAQLIRKHLGGEIIGIDDPTGYVVPKTMTMVPILSAHLFQMHGVYARELKSLKKLAYAHDQAHATPQYTDYVPHRHDDEPFSHIKEA